MRFHRALAPAVALALLSSAASVGAAAADPASMATPMATPVIHGSQLIKVSDCNPKLNVQQNTFYGYTPGYPGYAGYGYWGDVYGARYYQPVMTTTNPQLAIHYRNISAKTMSSIEFGLVANNNLVAEVKDVGTFSPGAEIKHKFGISANVFPIQTGLPQCIPLRITFVDGTKWRSPRLPPKSSTLYPH